SVSYGYFWRPTGGNPSIDRQLFGDIGHGVLTKFSLLNRYFRSLALPALTSSVELDHLKDDDRKLQLFTHRFAPLHRTNIVTLSLVLGHGLDDIYANVLSLLSLLKTLRVTDGKAQTSRKAHHLSRTRRFFRRLINIRHALLFRCLPRFKCLKTLQLHRMAIVLPYDLSAQSVRPAHLSNLNLCSVQILKNSATLSRQDLSTEFINFFSQSLESLSIKNLTFDLASQTHPVVAPRLCSLGLSFAPSQSHGLTPKTIETGHFEQIYRQVLESFSESPSLESINICEPIGLAQFKMLQSRGGFEMSFK
ncbi:hypothetical protein PSTT_05433, partial [Puccinia striiformis]